MVASTISPVDNSKKWLVAALPSGLHDRAGGEQFLRVGEAEFKQDLAGVRARAGDPAWGQGADRGTWRAVAEARLAPIDHTMRLENQGLSEADLAAELDRLTEDYARRGGRRLWDAL